MIKIHVRMPNFLLSYYVQTDRELVVAIFMCAPWVRLKIGAKIGNLFATSPQKLAFLFSSREQKLAGF